MAGINAPTLAAAINYIKKALDGMGVLKGAPCEVADITESAGAHIITLQWTTNSGVIKQATVTINDGVDGAKGDKGDTGLQGIQGERGLQGPQGIQGERGAKGDKGDKGDDGYPFLIYKQYDDITDFDETDFGEVGLMFMVMQAVTGQGYPVYRYTGEGDPPYSLVTYLASEGIKGEKGDKGDKGDPGDTGADGAAGQDGTTFIPEIGTVTTLPAGSNATVSVQTDSTTGKATFNFGIPKGDGSDVDLDPVYDAIDEKEPLIFFGTMAQWETLTDEQKAKYRTLKIPDVGYLPAFLGTQAEWEALTLGQKVVYAEAHITDDESSAVEAYSTAETKTGKVWIDGKPIYRIVFYSATNWANNTIVGNIGSFDTIISIFDTGSITTEGITTNYGFDSSSWIQSYVNANGDVLAHRSGAGVSSNPSHIIVEYTKA